MTVLADYAVPAQEEQRLFQALAIYRGSCSSSDAGPAGDPFCAREAQSIARVQTDSENYVVLNSVLQQFGVRP